MDTNTAEIKPFRIGEFLRSERERKNVTLEQIASATKINIKLLHALESDNFDALPAKPFIRGFITSYSRYIGLSSQDVLQRFESYIEQNTAQKFKRPENAPHIFVEREGTTDNSRTILSVIMAIFLITGFIIIAVMKPSLKRHRKHGSQVVTQMKNNEVYTVVPPPDRTEGVVNTSSAPQASVPKPATIAIVHSTTATAPTPAPPVPAPTPVVAVKPPLPTKPTAESSHTPVIPHGTPTVSAPTATPPMLTKFSAPTIPTSEVKYKLVIKALEDAWVKYQSDDRPISGFILKKDKVIYIKARHNIRFMSGNPKGIEYAYNNGAPQQLKVKALIYPKELESEFQNNMFRDVPIPPVQSTQATSNTQKPHP